MLSASFLCGRRIHLSHALGPLLRRDFTLKQSISGPAPEDFRYLDKKNKRRELRALSRINRRECLGFKVQPSEVSRVRFRNSDLPPNTAVLRPSGDVAEFYGSHSLFLAPERDREPAPINPLDIPGPYTRSMLSYVQVVCAPTADTPGASVLLHFDNRRYLFGSLSEGTQRIMNQQKIGMGKLDEIFLSGPVTWRNAGGILGLMLTIADVIGLRNVPDNNARKQNKLKTVGMPPSTTLKIYGAENITQMLATARRFIFRKGVPMSLQEIEHDHHVQETPARSPDFEDANVKVWFVSLKPKVDENSQSRKRSHDDMVAEDNAQSPLSGTTQQNEERRKLVTSVVDAMFNSDWQLDALVPTSLFQVQQPAAIFVKNRWGKVESYMGPLPGTEEGKNVQDIPVFVRTPWPASQIPKLPPATPSNQSLCYIVKIQPRRGKFKVEEAKRLGVAKPDYGRLARGETVKGKDGIDVTPEMCLEPAVEGKAFAYLDIPDTSYIDEFLLRPEWTDKEITGTIEIMYWRLGPGVLYDSRLQTFRQQRESVRHHVFSSDVSPNALALRDAAVNTIKSHRIDPDRFPLPTFTNEVQGKLPQGVNVAQPGVQLQLAPHVRLNEHALINPVQTAVIVKTMKPDVVGLAQQAQKKVSDANFLAEIEAAEKDIPNRDTEIITLGTGSAIPSKYRNVSATLVRVPGYGSYLFDCGENTLGQLRRMYGFEKANEILCDLKVIWISHLHADHHLGTASVIAAWRDATEAAASIDADASLSLPRLTVVSHFHMLDWIREYAEIEDIGIKRLNLLSIKGPKGKEMIQDPIVMNPFLAQHTGLQRIDACRVDHCHGSLACVFTWSSGLKVAYSGDCRPSPAFEEIGRGATLLIHEATLDDELISDARAKKHSTMSEALGVARSMRARRVLLTHFSQRYPKIANAYAHKSSGQEAVTDQAIMVGFDLMCVKLGDFRKAALFLPALRKLYENAEDDEPLRLD